jgi:prevent-host-death family protein
MKTVNIVEARAQLSKPVDAAEKGEAVCITRRGKAVAQITAVPAPKKRISAAMLRRVTEGMTFQSKSAGDFMRRIRDTDRY